MEHHILPHAPLFNLSFLSFFEELGESIETLESSEHIYFCPSIYFSNFGFALCLLGMVSSLEIIFTLLYIDKPNMMTVILIYYIRRSTIVHSNTIVTNEQHNFVSTKDRQTAEESYKNSRDTEAVQVNLSRAMQTPQRIPLGTHQSLTF